MRTKKQELLVYKSKQMGMLPGYLQLGMRFLEKEDPIVPTKAHTFIIPIDYLRMSVGELADDIKEIQMHFSKVLM
jgi:hypothetical protein